MSDESYTNAVIKEREEFRAHLLDIAKMTGNAGDIGAAWEGVAALVEKNQRLAHLASTCLHLAYGWNDHNQPPAHVAARQSAAAIGIISIDDANDFMERNDAVGQLRIRRSQGDPVGAVSGRQEYLHPDDAAVERFASAMGTKLAVSRANGRSGWDDPEQCTIDDLARQLGQEVVKGDPVDIANLAMMLWHRCAKPQQVSASLAEVRALAIEDAAADCAKVNTITGEKVPVWIGMDLVNYANRIRKEAK
ncbi:hypothetical protein [Zobellella denitrificans]|uniref:hypothetical protein n=1 Tax=Zobellella denitrificans TaxID=347534 RepID=UPI000BBEC184|nr:hypothetical protein [Zobellella denitrificans]